MNSEKVMIVDLETFENLTGYVTGMTLKQILGMSPEGLKKKIATIKSDVSLRKISHN